MSTATNTPNLGGGAPGGGAGTPSGSEGAATTTSTTTQQTTNPGNTGGSPAAAASTQTTTQPVKSGESFFPAGFADLLKEDLEVADTTTVQPGAQGTSEVNGADPLAALQDNPRVQQLQAAEKLVTDATALAPDYIKKPEHIQNAVQDAAVLWQISDGKLPVNVILDAAKHQSPQIFPKILADLKAFVEKELGQPIAANAAGAALTPDQQRIADLEKKITDRETAEKNAGFSRRVNAAKSQIIPKVAELLKDSVFEGEGDRFFNLTSSSLKGKELQVIEAAEKGDFKMIEAAIRQARSAETKLFNDRIQRMQKLWEKKRGTIPNQAAGGAPANAGENTVAITDKEQRLKAVREAMHR